MPKVDFLCLANSIKHGGRCIAGVRADGAGWIRALGPRNGALHPAHYVLEDLSEPRPLDLVAVELAKAEPAPHQPENWAISLKPWSLKNRGEEKAWRDLLKSAVTPGPDVLGGNADRVSFASFDTGSASASLTLVLPSRLSWDVSSGDGKRKIRAKVSLSGATYDLSVTDPQWRQALAERPDGEHPWGSLPTEASKVPLLTISLGEPFEGYCYKLVAAVIPVKPETADYIGRMPGEEQ